MFDREYHLIIRRYSDVIFFLIRIISEPRLQNPYLLYSNSHSSPYDYEYQQRKLASSFSHPCKFTNSIIFFFVFSIESFR
jgi:hypothetical protein